MPTISLEGIFNPQSIAVVGASRRPEAVGHAVFKNLMDGGYTGRLIPVNPKSEEILGLPCYPTLAEVPHPIDLAVLIVPAQASVPTFQQCIGKKVRGVIVISAGFKEIGAEGARLEQTLGRLAREHRIPLIGPNCLGVINTDPQVRMNASFGRSMPRQGRIAFLSQSGALCTAVLDYAKGTQTGFSKFVSMGNKADVTELELLAYLAEDPETDVILMYLEDLSHPREMIELCRRISGEIQPPKPILALKSGRTQAGAKAASSHTGSLAGSDEVYTTLFAQSGILRVDSVQELFDYAQAFSTRKLPAGNRVAIVTNAGGPGILATDASVRFGLELPTLSEATVRQIRQHLPPTASTQNPVDVIGDARNDRYAATLPKVLADPHVDAGIVILTPQAMTDIEEIARVIGETASQSPKPLLACFMGIVDISAGEEILRRWKVPHYRFPESAAQALSAMVRYNDWISRPRTEVRTFSVELKAARVILQQALSEGRKNLTDQETMAILKAYGFPTLPMTLCPSPESAAEAASRLGYPVALKISSPDILHKVDVGGVRLDLSSAPEVLEGAKQLLETVRRKAPAARILGVNVQPMADKGHEVILGLNRTPQFGPLLMFGLGGTYVEVLKDVTFRIAPIRPLGARKMIAAIRGYPILLGARGKKQADLPKLEECLQRLSQLGMQCPEIAELDINPLFIYEQGKGCVVADARILLEGEVKN